jgi:hypothetical protein
VRIRAHSDATDQRRDIYGNYTYFPDPNSVAFTFTGYAGGGGAPAYLQPAPNQLLRSTPVFRWQPFAPAYWVIVAKDPGFTTVVDYAFTKIPAWAPRGSQRGVGEWGAGDGVWTYTDEQTQYYWSVLAARTDGSGITVDPHFANPQPFLKQSQPPSFVTPANDGAVVVGPPTFRWTPVTGALSYQLQVSDDRNFGTLLDDQTTDSTEYTANRAYPSNAALYARVRVEDGGRMELTWSAPRRFQNSLATPTPSADNPSISDFIPTWTWKPVPGAVSYELHVDLPNGTKKDFFKILPAAFTATRMTGTGVFRWQVRAVFPGGRGGKESVGPFSREVAFTRTIRPPEGARALVGAKSIVLVWNPKLGADHYRVQIATTPDFAQRIESTDTDNPNFAPDLQNGAWTKATTFYWRVSAIDADHNTGNFTPVRTFKLHLPAPNKRKNAPKKK